MESDFYSFNIRFQIFYIFVLLPGTSQMLESVEFFLNIHTETAKINFLKYLNSEQKKKRGKRQTFIIKK